MDILAFLLVVCLSQTCHLSSAKPSETLARGTSLSVEKTSDTLISANGVFSAGFLNVGEHAFSFAIWFTSLPKSTVIWMANREHPVGARNSKLSLLKDGNLVLTDADREVLWTTNTFSRSSVELQLLDSGNLVLRTSEDVNLWASFDSPTDTLLPQQPLTKDTYLISSRSKTDYSSGYYKLFFNNDNVLSLLFQAQNVTSIYWPPPQLLPDEDGVLPEKDGRCTYNNSRIAVFDSLGDFRSSDYLKFLSADFGMGPLRRLTLDPDGNLRLYSLEEKTKKWLVSWQAIPQPCRVHGICGPNGVCSYDGGRGRMCTCLPGYKVKNSKDWSNGCAPEFSFPCNKSKFAFLKFQSVEFDGYGRRFSNYTLRKCEEECLKSCSCKGFQYRFEDGVYNCFIKIILYNGQLTPSSIENFYLKLPKDSHFFDKNNITASEMNCPVEIRQYLNKMYKKAPKNSTLIFWLQFAKTLGVVEVTCIMLMWCFLFRANQDLKATKQGYLLAASGFKQFTYAELKKATQGFKEEIGRGGGGVVYKGKLSDQRVAVIKRLKEANQGEAEFLAELTTIGKLNHINLIEMWGYCAEGKHRLLVYEYMEHGSLEDNLSSNSLDWEKRFEIAVGTAKGLAYLHDECLQWVLHCDIKPQNILLNSKYQPKVSDFGLSKLLNRGGLNDSNFSRIRGTRGYMAPEWVYNLPITSKVDVYSYGVVLLELVTGKSPIAGSQTSEIENATEHKGLVRWVREKINKAPINKEWIEEIVDPMISSNYNLNKMETLVKVALHCVEEEREARPTMSQVVEMLLSNEDERVKIF